MGLIAMAFGLLAAVIGGRDGQEVILQIGMLDAGMAADEAAGLEMVGGARAAAEEGPLHADQELAQRALHHGIEGDRLQAGVLDIGLEMVLQVLPDAGQVLDHRDLELPQMIGGTDARQHQDLRRIDGAARDDHLAPGAGDRLLARPSYIPRPMARRPSKRMRVVSARVTSSTLPRRIAGLR